MLNEKGIDNTQKVIPGLDVLGCPYNINGTYATEDSVLKSRPVIDWSKMESHSVQPRHNSETYRVPIHVEVNSAGTRYEEKSGSSFYKTLSDFSSELSIAGNYKGFSGELESNFSVEVIKNTNNSYTEILNILGEWSLGIHKDFITVEIISEEWKDIFHNTRTIEDAKDVYENFGTHILTGAVIGAKSVYASATDTTKFSNTIEFKLLTKLEFQKLIGSLSGSALSKFRTQLEEMKSASKTNCYTKGGRTQDGGQNILSPEGWDRWSSNIGNQIEFVDFISHHGLNTVRPLLALFEIAELFGKKEIFKKAYDLYMVHEESISPVFSSLRYYTDMRVVRYNPETELPVNNNEFGPNNSNINEWTPIKKDLNADAGGDYLWLYSKIKTFEEVKLNSEINVITDILIKENKDSVDGYRLIHKNLNAGISYNPMSELWLFIKEERIPSRVGFGFCGVTDVIINAEDDDDPNDLEGYTRCTDDLNLDVGGDYIWLYYKTHE